MAVSIVGTPSASTGAAGNILVGANRTYAHTVAAGTGALLVLVVGRQLNDAAALTIKWGGSGGVTLTTLFDMYASTAPTQDDAVYWIGILENPTVQTSTIYLSPTNDDIRAPVVVAWNIAGYNPADPVSVLSEMFGGSASNTVTLSGTIPAGSLSVFAHILQSTTAPTITSSTSTGWTQRFSGAFSTNDLAAGVIKDTLTLTGAQTTTTVFSQSDADRGGVFFVVNPITTTAYDSDRTETVTLTDAVTSILAMDAALTETTTLADVVAATVGIPADQTETLTLGDIYASTIDLSAAQTESITLGESTDAALVGDNTQTEVTSLGDQIDASVSMPVEVAEVITLGDEVIGGLEYISTVEEAFTLGDTVVVDIDIAAAVEETLNLNDTVDAPNLQAVAAQTETVTLSDSVASIAAMEATQTETTTLGDTVTASQAWLADIEEEVTLTDIYSAGNDFQAPQDETVTLGDSYSAEQTFAGTLTETLTLSDASNASTDYAADRGDVITLGDSYVSTLAMDVALEEAVELLDEVSGGKDIAAALTELVMLGDTVSVSVNFAASVTETITLGDGRTLIVGVEVDILEILALSVGEEVDAALVANVSETVTLLTTQLVDKLTATVAGGIKGRQQMLSPGEYIELWQIDLSLYGGPIRYFQNNEVPIFFGGKEYLPFPIMAEGFESTTEAQVPRPTLKVSNAVRSLAAELAQWDNLRGATVTRIRTLYRYTDGQADADPEQHWEPDIYRIDRVSAKSKLYVEFELVTEATFTTTTIPRRKILRTYCQHTYRRWNGEKFIYGSCPYNGTRYYTKDDRRRAEPEHDRCSKHLTGCRMRFDGAKEPLPMRAFPQVARRAK